MIEERFEPRSWCFKRKLTTPPKSLSKRFRHFKPNINNVLYRHEDWKLSRDHHIKAIQEFLLLSKSVVITKQWIIHKKAYLRG